MKHHGDRLCVWSQDTCPLILKLNEMRQDHSSQQEPLQNFCVLPLQSSFRGLTRTHHGKVTATWSASFPHYVSGISSAFSPKISWLSDYESLRFTSSRNLTGPDFQFCSLSVVHLAPLLFLSMPVPHTERVSFSPPTSLKCFGGMLVSLGRKTIHQQRPGNQMAQWVRSFADCSGQPRGGSRLLTMGRSTLIWMPALQVNMSPWSSNSQPLVLVYISLLSTMSV